MSAVVMGYGSSLTVRRQARDSDGDPIGAPVDTTTTGWLFEPVSATEDRDGGRGTRQAALTRLRGYTRAAGLAIGPGDRAWLDGDDRDKPPPWHVVGDPEKWGAPGWSALAGTVVALERASG